MPGLKRLVDVSIAAAALVALSPLLLAAAVGIKLSSTGPILFQGRRTARDRRRVPSDGAPANFRTERRRQGYQGREFTIFKFRTMRASGAGHADPITAWKDSRVFPFGEWLRSTKIDELPQLLNVIKGDMALVGPRPEAPEIVNGYYTDDDLATLQVLPGVTSPGTVYYYSHCETMLVAGSAVEVYVDRLLPIKLALDRVYIKHASVTYDLRVMLRTAMVIAGRVCGRRRFPDPPELAEAELLVGLRNASTSPGSSDGKWPSITLPATERSGFHPN